MIYCGTQTVLELFISGLPGNFKYYMLIQYVIFHPSNFSSSYLLSSQEKQQHLYIKCPETTSTFNQLTVVVFNHDNTDSLCLAKKSF